MFSGMPRLQIPCSKNLPASSWESISCLQGRWIAILVNRSTITKNPIYAEAVDSGRSVTNSMVTPSQGRDTKSAVLRAPKWLDSGLSWKRVMTLLQSRSIVWYIYASFVGENSSSDFPFVARFFHKCVISLQVRDVVDWSADNPVFHFGSERVNRLGCFDFLKEVIVRFNGGSCQGCQ